MPFIGHKLVVSARIRAIKAELAQPLNEISPLTRRPSAHKSVPYSGQYRQSLAGDDPA